MTMPTTISSISDLTNQLTVSMRKPSRRTLTLINKALSYLTPFESPRAAVSSYAEKTDLLELLNEHRNALSPYLDLDRIERNLKCC